ncbi:hypothetical protein X797_011662 [Metarhizium robertsii]|uniref:Ribonuclease H-like protein n=2 Tax=Metarhizium robertsii TaxID=568076 RepID=A0A0B2XGB7_METRA|nr:Ribonuclease H-like protein [Metarhizium robertsii ARSEF 23]EXU95259.1 hypothetical protein X797_011662 [Metarhizium robertsii]KHO10592.1 Ribonuclease H-like protein [Metarhizium robertsii ARSEF 23]
MDGGLGDQGLVTCVAAAKPAWEFHQHQSNETGYAGNNSQVASGRRRGCDKAGIPHAAHAAKGICIHPCMWTVLTLGSPGGIVEGKVLDGPPRSSTRPVSGAIGRSCAAQTT